MTGIGSTYFHLRPGNDTLIWDKLPVTLVLMSFVAVTFRELVTWKSAMWACGPVLLWASYLFGAGIMVEREEFGYKRGCRGDHGKSADSQK